MRRFVKVLSTLAIIVLLTGCASTAQQTETTTIPTTVETTNIETTSETESTTSTSIEEIYQPDPIPMSNYSELPTINNSEMGAWFERGIGAWNSEQWITYRAMSWEPGLPISWFMRLWLTDNDNVSEIDWMTIPCVPDTILDSKDANDQNVWSGPILSGRICNYANIIDELNRMCTSGNHETYFESLLVGQTYTSESGETAIVDYRLMLNILVNFGDEHLDHQLDSKVFEAFGYTEEEVRNYVYEIDDENPILDYSLIVTDNEYYTVYADELG